MHELSITRSIVELCAERAGDRRVARVTLEIGRLSGVVADSLRFCYDLCTEGTPLEGSALEIIDIAGKGRCRDCAREVSLDGWPALCECGSANLEWSAGEELRIKEMELAENKNRDRPRFSGNRGQTGRTAFLGE